MDTASRQEQIHSEGDREVALFLRPKGAAPKGVKYRVKYMKIIAGIVA